MPEREFPNKSFRTRVSEQESPSKGFRTRISDQVCPSKSVRARVSEQRWPCKADDPEGEGRRGTERAPEPWLTTCGLSRRIKENIMAYGQLKRDGLQSAIWIRDSSCPMNRAEIWLQGRWPASNTFCGLLGLPGGALLNDFHVFRMLPRDLLRESGLHFCRVRGFFGTSPDSLRGSSGHLV